MARRTGFAAVLILLAAGIAADYPLIRRLSNDDVLFRQFHEDLERYNRAAVRGEDPPPFLLYRYTPGPEENIFTLAARFTLPYESIATLNGLDRSSAPITGRPLLVPNTPGVFLRERPGSFLERLLHSWRRTDLGVPVSAAGERYVFFPGARFHPVERAYFLSILFHPPLDEWDVTSRYGSRVSPVSGRVHFHNGLDLAAPRGSRVYAAREGRVSHAGFDPVLGRHVRISHPGGYETVYGHLESILVELNQTVESGMIIGGVGTTGASTGAHLHFEIRRKGEARDPEGLLPRRNRS